MVQLLAVLPVLVFVDAYPTWQSTAVHAYTSPPGDYSFSGHGLQSVALEGPVFAYSPAGQFIVRRHSVTFPPLLVVPLGQAVHPSVAVVDPLTTSSANSFVAQFNGLHEDNCPPNDYVPWSQLTQLPSDVDCPGRVEYLPASQDWFRHVELVPPAD